MAGIAQAAPSYLSGGQTRRVPAQMIVHEAGDEVVAVVVAGLAPQGEGYPRFLARGLQQLGPQLLGEERVGVAIVDQKFRESGAVLDQRDGVVLAPGVLVLAEIASQRLDAPGNTGRRHDRREGAGGAIAIAI